MALRMIEIFAPAEYVDSIRSFLDEHEHHGVRTDCLSDDRCLVRVLVAAESTEAVIDVIEDRFSNVDGFRLMLLAVEATLPRLPEKPPAPREGEERSRAEPRPAMRISREELYEDLEKGARLSSRYLVMLFLSTVVLAVALIRDNPAVTALWTWGIRPKRWWEARKAGRATVRAVGVCCLLPLAATSLVVVNSCTAPGVPGTDAEKKERIEEMFEGYRSEFPEVPVVGVGEYVGRSVGEDFLLVDVRPEAERSVSMIPGAVSREDFEAHLERYEQRKIVCYCTIGYRSGKYASRLRERGLEAVNLRGGILSWLHGGGTLRNAEGETREVHVYGPEWDLAPAGWRTRW